MEDFTRPSIVPKNRMKIKMRITMLVNKLSKQVKREADLLLKKTKLLNLLSEYGEVIIRGSYELDLMVDGDIDIYILEKKFNKDSAIELLNELIIKNDFRGYMFYDFVKRRKKGFPKGYYIGLKTKTASRKWKIDIWLMKSMDNVSDRFMKKISQKLDTQKRHIILKLKKIVKDQKTGLPSFVVYDAVIEGGVSNMKQLLSYANQAGYKIEK